MHISKLVVKYLQPKGFGCLVSNPVCDNESEGFYFSYEGYIVHLVINVNVKEIDNELYVVISSVENNTYKYDCNKISKEEILNSLISDVFYLKELFSYFPLNLKQLQNNKER